MARERSYGAIIFTRKNGLRYLLLHYAAGHWDFAKGHPEKGETEKSTVKREVVEETGIRDLKLIDGFRERIVYFFKKGDTTILKEVIFLLAETSSDEVMLSPEHTGYKWLSFEGAVKKATHLTAKDLLKKADDFLSKVEA